MEWISYEEYLKQEPVKRTVPGHLLEYMMAKVKYLLVKLRG